LRDHEAEPRIRTEPGFEAAWPGASALATECILNLGWWAERLAAYGEAVVRAHGIPSRAAFNVLEILRGAGSPLPPSTIADRMIITRPTMTGILATLERHGLVRRHPHASDRRMSLIEITAQGAARGASLRARLHQAEKQWMAGLSADEQRTLLDLVAKLQAAMPETAADG
jgi:DNA-binding MarR family transcriptional regulator